MQLKTRAYIAIIFAPIIWGLTPIMSVNLLPFGTPLTFVSIRMFVSSLTIMAFLIFKGNFHLPKLNQLPILIFLGILSVCLSSNLILEGLKYSTVLNYSLINLTAPVFIAILGYLFFKNKLLNIQCVGLLITIISVIYIVIDGNFSTLIDLQLNRGDILFLIVQVSWALYTIISAKIINIMPSFYIVMWSSFFGAIINILYGYYSGDLQMPIINDFVIINLAYNTWISSMFGILLWVYGVSIIGSSIAGPFMNITTIVGIASGILFLGEEPKISHFLGTIGLVVGIYILTQHQKFTNFFIKMKIKKLGN